MAFTNHIRALALASILVATGALTPLTADAGKQANKLPRADLALAAFEATEGRVGIAVKVENATSVTVVYNGATREAVPVAPTKWWNAEFDGGAQNCYRIIVRARNQHGTISRRLGAGQVGTAGCADCGDAETAVTRAHHKVKHAKAALRNADSPSERHDARHKLKKAKRRLASAEQRLEACEA
jgi:hypothetical protein